MKYWEDSAAPDGRPGSRADRYARLVAQRDRPDVRCCTPEEHAGPLAQKCPGCSRMTVHQLAGFCCLCEDSEDAREEEGA